jgi:hypothetical protein
MKLLLLCAVLLFLSWTCLGQERKQQYFSLQGMFFPNPKADNYAGGATFSVGRYQSAGITVGAGFGVIMFDEPYIPGFLEFAYIGKPKKISPFVKGQLGWAIYDGPADMIGEPFTVKGGLYTNIMAGAGYGIGKKGSRAAVHVGAMPLMLRRKLFNKTDVESGVLFHAGVSFTLVN